MEKKGEKFKEIVINALFLMGVVAALFMEQSVILILWALPFVLFDRSFVIPLFLYIPLLEGAFNLEADFPAETVLIATYTPFILYDLLNHKYIKIPRPYKRLFYFFLFMIGFGTIVAIMNMEFDMKASSILVANFSKFLKVVFFFMYMVFLVGHGLTFILKGLRHLTIITPLLLLAILAYMELFGIAEGIKEMLNFGYSKHGYFTATLVSISSYSLWYFFNKGRSLFFRIFILITMLGTMWIILQSGSRNGLLSFVVMIVVSIYFFIGLHFKFRNVIVVALLLLPTAYFVWQNMETAAIERLTQVTITRQGIEGQGIQRLDLWQGAVKGFLDKPVTGVGGSNELSRVVGRRNAGIDNVVHNTFLEITLQFGILGIILFFLLQYRIFKGTRLINMEALRQEPEESRFMIPFVAYISLFFSSMFVSWIWSSSLWYNVSIIFAISVLIAAREKDNKKETHAA